MNIIAELRTSKIAFKIGILLLIINPPLGYLGFIVGAYLSIQYDDKSYFGAATVFYFFTWMLAGLGIILSGPCGFKLVKDYLKKIVGRKI